jgi:hypothetical protein
MEIKVSNKRKLSVIFLIFIGGLGVLFLLQTKNPAPESSQRRSAVQLLVPGGPNIVEVERDLTDTKVGPVQVGMTAAAASFDGSLRDLPQVGPDEKSLGVEFEFAGSELSSDPDFVDPARQRTLRESNLIPGPIQNFGGLDLNNWGAGWPPDTQGDVGPNHYIQAVNTSIGIYSKTGSQLAAFTFDTLFAGSLPPRSLNSPVQAATVRHERSQKSCGDGRMGL